MAATEAPANRPDWFIEPTVIRGPLPDEVTFGPIVTVEPFDGELGR
jgi:acyl-CoA reductase-like NAD-dependent aldehyde dehydrogenase